MKIFFGKIKATVDNKQIKGAYYQTLSPMKLGEITTGAYAFIITGGSIHLWQAKERVDLEGQSKMIFDVVEEDLPLNSKKIVAFKYFKLDSSLIVLTIRQSPKAFYPIEIADSALSEETLRDPKTYEDPANFRAIHVLSKPEEVIPKSQDVQLFFNKQGNLEVYPASFYEPGMLSSFVDNLSKEGYGRKLKDKALAKIKQGQHSSIRYDFNQLPILRMYDALFAAYGNIEDTNLPIEDELEDLEEPKDISSLELKSFNQIYYGPPGTGKTYLVRESFCLEEEIKISGASHRIKLNTGKNFWHLAPGRNAYLWDKLRTGDLLGYEWVDKSWGDIRELTHKKIQEEGWGSFQLIAYLREVKKGDYICVISGRKFLGIAEVLEEYDYERAVKNDFEFQTVPVKWLKQFEQPLLLNSSQTKTFVRLNHGARWGTLLTLLREHGFYFEDTELAEHTIVKPKNFSFITFHQSFSYEDFIEGIKPVLSDVEEDETAIDVQYAVVPGVFYQACERAVQLAGYDSLQDCLADNKFNRQKMFSRENVLEYYLIIDELNRGNVASIFGELITLIEDDKRIGSPTEIVATLPYSKTLFGVPSNLRIIGTMNTADRSVEALDTALRRRFSFEEMLPDPTRLSQEIEGLDVNLRKLLETINNRLEKLIGRDYTVGHSFFMRVTKIDDLRKVICNKVIPLLQEYFYSDYARIGLVIGSAFLTIRNEKTSFMRIPGFDSSELEDKTVFNLKDIDEMKDDEFLLAIRSIYGE
jgi:5-methylcytosine-specific restriction protein B